MALKDLIADKSALTEEAIEGIVSAHIHYYLDTGEIGFKPDGQSLSNERKILVYLTAIHGWRYVTDNPPDTPTKPANLSDALGIPGGTLRPTLKSLKDSHLITADGGEYAIQTSRLSAIASTVNGEKKTKGNKRTAKSARGKVKKKKTASRKPASKITSRLQEWIKEGYFGRERTLQDVHTRFHEKGIIVQKTSLSGPLLQAVQEGHLKRKKLSIDGKNVWTYLSATEKD